MSSSIKSPHQKHISLAKPDLQQFGRNEVAMIGSTCSSIQKMATRISIALSDQYCISYVDAEHTTTSGSVTNNGRGITTEAGFESRYYQGSTAQQFTFYKPLHSYQLKPFFNEQDLVLLNGNHFEAQAQIVIVDSRKPLDPDRLGDVKMIILQKGIHSIPKEISKRIPHLKQIPVFKIDQIAKIADACQQLIDATVPPLSGLVLAGGKSTRMYTDKTQLDYHGKPQRQHLYELLGRFCEDVFISCRKEQSKKLSNDFNVITDSFLQMGPLGALLSAFREQPNTAWFTVACDLPLLSAQTLQKLVHQRNPSKIATAFMNNDSGFPEPLITIWEPKSYLVLLQFLGIGHSCPRKTLINSDVELLEPPHSRELMNVNTPQEYEEALEAISVS